MVLSPVIHLKNSSLALDRDQDGAQFINHLVGQPGLGGNFGVEPYQRILQLLFKQRLIHRAVQIGGRAVLPLRAIMFR